MEGSTLPFSGSCTERAGIARAIDNMTMGIVNLTLGNPRMDDSILSLLVVLDLKKPRVDALSVDSVYCGAGYSEHGIA